MRACFKLAKPSKNATIDESLRDTLLDEKQIGNVVLKNGRRILTAVGT